MLKRILSHLILQETNCSSRWSMIPVLIQLFYFDLIKFSYQYLFAVFIKNLLSIITNFSIYTTSNNFKTSILFFINLYEASNRVFSLYHIECRIYKELIFLIVNLLQNILKQKSLVWHMLAKEVDIFSSIYWQ